MSQQVKSLRKEREAIRESMQRMTDHFGPGVMLSIDYMELKKREDDLTKKIVKILGGKDA